MKNMNEAVKEVDNALGEIELSLLNALAEVAGRRSQLQKALAPEEPAGICGGGACANCVGCRR